MSAATSGAAVEVSRWRVLGRANRPGYVVAVCECGTEREVLIYSIRNGSSRSCGCLARELSALRKTTHGLSKTPEYAVWVEMLRRTSAPDHPNWHLYGGRGITTCDEWRASFEAFISDVGPRPNDTYSIDRIDVNGNYEPGNVRWATASQQNFNRRLATVCRNGHPLEGGNVLTHFDVARGRTRRRCKTCQHESQKRYEDRGRRADR